MHQAASEHAAKEANAAGERGAKLQRELAEQVCPSCNSHGLLTLLCLTLLMRCYDGLRRTLKCSCCCWQCTCSSALVAACMVLS